MVDLNGRRVVVSGASSGIGIETARRLGRAGASVCLVARRPEPVAEAAGELGPEGWGHPCDVSDPAQVEKMAAAVHSRWGGLDGLVNNAGVTAVGKLEETDLETWDQTFGVNVRGAFLMTQHLLPLLRKGSSPAVVNVSSTLAERAIPGMAAYSASKAALNQLTRSLAVELAPKVRVNAVMPAVVDTPIHAARGLTPGQVKAMGRLHPMRRIGQPADVAAMIVFLLSEAASWMTGAIVPVDGGMMAT